MSGAGVKERHDEGREGLGVSPCRAGRGEKIQSEAEGRQSLCGEAVSSPRRTREPARKSVWEGHPSPPGKKCQLKLPWWAYVASIESCDRSA